MYGNLSRLPQCVSFASLGNLERLPYIDLKSALTANHARHAEMSIGGVRRILERLLLAETRLNIVFARGKRRDGQARAAMLPRLDRRSVEFVELVNVFDDGGQLHGEGLLLFRGQFQVGEF